MGFFDDLDDGDFFSKPEKGSGGSAAPSKPKSAPVPAPPHVNKPMLDDDDDDDDDFFKDFKVDLDVDLLAPKPLAPAAIAPSKAAPVAAATPIGGHAYDDMVLMGDADVDLLMPDGDVGAKVNAAEQMEVDVEESFVQTLPTLAPQTEPAPPASVAPPTQQASNPQPQPQELLLRNGGGMAQPCPPHAATAEIGAGYNAEAAAMAEPLVPAPAVLEPGSALKPGGTLEPGGSGRVHGAIDGEREAFVATPMDCTDAADPAPQLTSTVATEVLTADATMTDDRGSGKDDDATTAPAVKIGTTAGDVEQLEGKVQCLFQRPLCPSTWDPQAGQPAAEDAVGLPVATGGGNNNPQEMAQNAVGAAILLDALPPPALAAARNVPETATAHHLHTALNPASSNGPRHDGAQQLKQAAAAATEPGKSGTITDGNGPTPDGAGPQQSSKLPMQQRPAQKAKLPQPLTQPSQSSSQAAIAQVALATPAASAANLGPQAQQAGSAVIVRAASSQSLSAAAVPLSVAVAPAASDGAAIIANSNAMGALLLPNPARPFSEPGQRRLMGRGLIGGPRGPAAAAGTHALQVPLSLQQQQQQPPLAQLQQQGHQHHHQQGLSSQPQPQGSVHGPGTGVRPKALGVPPPQQQQPQQRSSDLALAAQATVSRPTLNLLAPRQPAHAVPQPSLPKHPPAPQEGAQSQTAAALIPPPTAALSSLQQQRQQQLLQQGKPWLLQTLPAETAGTAAVPTRLVTTGTTTVSTRATLPQAAGSLEGPVTPGVSSAAAPILSAPGMAPTLRAWPPAGSVATDAGSHFAPAAARTAPLHGGVTGQATSPAVGGATLNETNTISNRVMTPTAVRTGPDGRGAVSSLPQSTPLPSLTGAPTPQPAFSFPTPAPYTPIVAAAFTAAAPTAAVATPQSTQLGAGSASVGAAAGQPPAARPAWPAGEGIKISPLPLPALAAAIQSPVVAAGPATPAQSAVGASLAAVLAGPIKALEMMLLEAQAMRDQALELRVQSAVLSNRLVRLDNPVLRDRITAAKANAMEALHANEQLLADLVSQPVAAMVVTAGATAQSTSDTDGN